MVPISSPAISLIGIVALTAVGVAYATLTGGILVARMMAPGLFERLSERLSLD